MAEAGDATNATAAVASDAAAAAALAMAAVTTDTAHLLHTMGVPPATAQKIAAAYESTEAPKAVAIDPKRPSEFGIGRGPGTAVEVDWEAVTMCTARLGGNVGSSADTKRVKVVLHDHTHCRVEERRGRARGGPATRFCFYSPPPVVGPSMPAEEQVLLVAAAPELFDGVAADEAAARREVAEGEERAAAAGIEVEHRLIRQRRTPAHLGGEQVMLVTGAPHLFDGVAAEEEAARKLAEEEERAAAAGVEVEHRLLGLHLRSDPTYLSRQRDIEQLALPDAMARGRSNAGLRAEAEAHRRDMREAEAHFASLAAEQRQQGGASSDGSDGSSDDGDFYSSGDDDESSRGGEGSAGQGSPTAQLRAAAAAMGIALPGGDDALGALLRNHGGDVSDAIDTLTA